MYFVDMPTKPDAGDDRNRYPVVITFRVSLPVAQALEKRAAALEWSICHLCRRAIEDQFRNEVPQ